MSDDKDLGAEKHKAVFYNPLSVVSVGNFIEPNFFDDWGEDLSSSKNRYALQNPEKSIIFNKENLLILAENEEHAVNFKSFLVYELREKMSKRFPLADSPLFSGVINYDMEMKNDMVSENNKNGVFKRIINSLWGSDDDQNLSSINTRGKSYWGEIMGDNMKQFSKNGEPFGSFMTVLNDFNSLVNSNTWTVDTDMSKVFGLRNVKLLCDSFRADKELTSKFLLSYAAEKNTSILQVYRMSLVIAKLMGGINKQDSLSARNLEVVIGSTSDLVKNHKNQDIENNRGFGKLFWAMKVAVENLHNYTENKDIYPVNNIKNIDVALILSHGASKKYLKELDDFKDLKNLNLNLSGNNEVDFNIEKHIKSILIKTHDLFECFKGYSWANIKYKNYLLEKISDMSMGVDVLAVSKERESKQIFFKDNCLVKLSLKNYPSFTFNQNEHDVLLKQANNHFDNDDGYEKTLRENIAKLRNQKSFMDVIANNATYEFCLHKNLQVDCHSNVGVNGNSLYLFLDKQYCDDLSIDYISKSIKEVFNKGLEKILTGKTYHKFKMEEDIEALEIFPFTKEKILSHRLKDTIDEQLEQIEEVPGDVNNVASPDVFKL